MTQHEHPFHYYRSPEEIREVQFSHRVRGLDEYEVAEYLDLLADQVHATNLEMARLRDERDRLRLENEHLHADGVRGPVTPSPYSSPQAQPQAASLLLNAQKVADDLVEEAVRRARDMLTVARAEKNAILRNAKEEAAALLVEAREAATSSTSSYSSQSSYSPPGSSYSQQSSPHSGSRHSAPPTPPTPMHLAPAPQQRSWQLDGHAV